MLPFRARLLLALWPLAASCSVGEIDLEGKECPCASGYTCDLTTNRCIVGNPAGGGSGNVGGGSSGGAGGGGGNSLCELAAENETLTLSCPPNSVVVSIDFASYGDPLASCGQPDPGSCHASSSSSVVSCYCLGKNTCSVGANNGEFGDPCEGVGKALAVRATCGPPKDAGSSGGSAGSCSVGTGGATSGGGGAPTGGGGSPGGGGTVSGGTGGVPVGGGGATSGGTGGVPTGGGGTTSGGGTGGVPTGGGGTTGASVVCGASECSAASRCCIGSTAVCQSPTTLCNGVPVLCDGPEDCGTGKVCCLMVKGATPNALECVPGSQCEAKAVVCGATPSVCAQPLQCATSADLPPYKICSG
ncbi:MAG: hypothetical protein U0263_14135 [Polyangiaceae bacterium]